jgi:SAM-dependent methyltransferase
MSLNKPIRTIQNTWRIFYNTSRLHKFLYFLAFLVCMSLITNYGKERIEGFKPATKTNEFKTNEDISQIYDDFYVDIYDDLVFSKMKNDYEIGKIIEYTKPTEQSVILDIGSGTGHHVSSLLAHGFKAKGIDISPSMVKKSKQTYPDLDFKVADALDTMTFTSGAFTHITCLYFTIYYIKDKRKFFENCMHWLMPGGFLAVHIVNRDKFDPILPAGSPFGIISPQNYTKKRITSTTVNFDEFEYKSNFVLKDKIKSADDPSALMVETFKNNTNGNIRRNEHKLYMLTQAEILDIAKESGFIIHSKIDLLKCQYENQYVYILEKPE